MARFDKILKKSINVSRWITKESKWNSDDMRLYNLWKDIKKDLKIKKMNDRDRKWPIVIDNER